ncbi:pogo transposable element with KRAB domain [Rhizophagus clarus]|uniref:Pogo transposable element with KRAB domain n=1 Tax=Rhizophagus clarus TaxID=94130 RepID=A0A8H3LIE6_9GLOM|nr:pogo transposable element with KRAB domain [Rhizophagus clarus]
MIGRWVTTSTSWSTETKSHSLRIDSGQKAFYPEAEKKLYKPDIIALYSDVTESFKGSLRWLNCFMKKYKLSLRRHTKVSQKLSQQIEELLENFCQYIMHLRINNSYELCNIFNMDKIPVYFDMAGNFTINSKGDKTIHIHCTGNEKNHFTVILICAADGTKLSPICIFKGKQMPHEEQAPTSIIVRPKTPKMMVYDSFRGHLHDSIKKDFHETGFDLAVIPGGLTSICQPFDVVINKPFKDNLWKEWHLWMANSDSLMLNKDTNKESEEFEIINDSDGEELMDMIIPCARYIQIRVHFLICSN